jgi:hypothetical protein
MGHAVEPAAGRESSGLAIPRVEAGIPYLEKPFSPEALGRMLRSGLSPATPSE